MELIKVIAYMMLIAVIAILAVIIAAKIIFCDSEENDKKLDNK